MEYQHQQQAAGESVGRRGRSPFGRSRPAYTFLPSKYGSRLTIRRWPSVLDAIVIYPFYSASGSARSAQAGGKHRNFVATARQDWGFIARGLSLGDCIFRQKSDIWMQQTTRQRQRMLEAIVIYRILYANSIAATRFWHSKFTSTDFFRRFSVSVLLL